jgi:RNA polymerase sigma factor (TIGR02999 family)
VVTTASNLYAAAYGELLRLARRERRHGKAPSTINTTALVHEAWFKLREQLQHAQLERDDFLPIAARAMRQVLIDYARRAHARKRQHITVSLGKASDSPAGVPALIDVIGLDTALHKLEEIDARLARIVELHVFSGLAFDEIAQYEGISERTTFRAWRNARVFLLDQMGAA